MESIEQGTPQWFDLKRGKISATHMADILMKPDNAGYRNYLAKLLLERVTGATEETYCSYDMQRGIELEESARACYSFETYNIVEQVAWVDHPTIKMAGCSPDGLIGLDGGVEFKCPKAATHLNYIMTGKIDRDYMLQMQWQMACANRKWIDFASYHPAFPEDKQLKIIRVLRDEEKIAELEDAAIKFDMQVDLMMRKFLNS